MLDELAALGEQQMASMRQYSAARSAAIPAEVHAALERINAEYEAHWQPLRARMDVVEANIKQAVLERGASVKGAKLHAIYVKGRVSWDRRYLDIYAASHPEIQPARQAGQPSVTIREVR